MSKAYQFKIKLQISLCTCMLFTATKNGDQPLAVWRMVQKFAFRRCRKQRKSTSRGSKGRKFKARLNGRDPDGRKAERREALEGRSQPALRQTGVWGALGAM